ncbi:MAG: FAD-binding dehydrogenase [Solirubrobacteraceae bacterium]
MTENTPDVIVVGAGLAGLVSTLELLRSGHSVLLLDRCQPKEIGGLAREAFGGMFMVDSPEQRRSRIPDNEALALEDWLRIAEFDPEDTWPRRWAEQYVTRARDDVGGWLRQLGVKFFPVVNWAERGNFGDGNSVPRFHLTWGTGKALVQAVWGAIESHPRRVALDLRLRSRVTGLIVEDGRAVGCRVTAEHTAPRARGGMPQTESTTPKSDEPGRVAEDQLDNPDGYEVRAAKAVVIAAGGIGGNLELVRREWPTERLGPAPEKLLMGSHYYADGALHEEVRRLGGHVTHLSRMWNYADAVRHPKPQREHHGLKLIPPRSGVMLNPDGRRYGPVPVMPTFDAYSALERMCEDERKYSWLVCNFKIAKRELDVSGSQHNPNLREKRLVPFLLSVVLGKPGLVQHFLDGSPDFVSASTLGELAVKMNEVTGDNAIDAAVLEREIGRYDETIARGKGLFNDDQLRRIGQLRNWRGDRLRTSRFQRIVDPKAMPLLAIRLQPMARKSLGGIQTDLGCRVLGGQSDEPIPGLYAVGEAAGFGGGGVHGKRSLEGTFLGGCVFTGRLAAATIAGAELPLRIPPRVD